MKYVMVNKETEITVRYFDDLNEAEKEANEMTKYHQKEYIVKEL